MGHDELFGGEGADTFVLSLGQGLDIIRDFGVGNDVLGLADGLTFEDLSFTIVGNHTQISVSEQVLARIRNFTTALSSSDFVPIV